jgi:predicted translin family RNA/ssDNA-binding protein
MMEAIYESINRFDYPSGLIPIKRKQDIARSLVEKTRGELAVASSEQRIVQKTDEIQGYIGELKGEKKKKKKAGELDLDRVW